MIYDWLANLTGKERKTELRDAPISVVQKIEDMVSMVADPEARFSVTKTLETLKRLEPDLSPQEKEGRPGAFLLYLQGYIHALCQDWPEAMTYWDALTAHPFGVQNLGTYFTSQITWGRTQCAYAQENWGEALAGFDARVADETSKGNSGLADLWNLQMMRGWCLIHLEQFDEANKLATDHMSPGLSEDEAHYFYPEERMEPLRILSAAQRGQGDIDGAFQTAVKELEYYETEDPESFEHMAVTLMRKAVNDQNWAAAHLAFDKLSSYFDGVQYDHVKQRLVPKLEEWRLKRASWPR